MFLYINKIIIILFFIFSTNAWSEKLKINTQIWPPYQTVDASGKVGGRATKVIECVLKEIDVDYEIKVLPWKRAQDEVKRGKADAFYSAGSTKERNQYAVATNQILNFNWVWVLKMNSKLDPDKSDFKNIARVGVKAGTSLEIYLMENKYNIVAKPKEIEYLIQMLIKDRFDAFLAPQEALNEIKNKDNYKFNNLKLYFHSNNPLYFYFSKKYIDKNEGVMRKFNAALKNYNFS